MDITDPSADHNAASAGNADLDAESKDTAEQRSELESEQSQLVDDALEQKGLLPLPDASPADGPAPAG